MYIYSPITEKEKVYVWKCYLH